MNKRIKKSIFLLSFLIIWLLGTGYVLAVNKSFSLNKTNMNFKIGETQSFSINGKGVVGKFKINVSPAGIVEVKKSIWVEDKTETISVKALKAGKATITVVADDVSTIDEQEVKGEKSISVVVAVPEPEKKPEPKPEPKPEVKPDSKPAPTPKPEEPKEKSSESRLKNFGVRPNEYDFSGFSKKREQKDWNIEVPNDVESLEIYGEPLDSKAKVKGLGKVKLSEGDNLKTITVTAENGKERQYVLHIKRRTAEEERKKQESTENRIKEINIIPNEYQIKNFDKDKFEYSIKVPQDLEKINIEAKLLSDKSKISGTGEIKLENEKSTKAVLEVVATNGEKKEYIINIEKEQKSGVTLTAKNGLKTLEISGIELNPNFDSSKFEYRATTENTLTELDIQVKAINEDATVEIMGNKNLKIGENVITILVKEKDSKEIITYQILLTINEPKEVEEPMSWLKPSTWGQEEKVKIAIVIALVILLIILIGIKIHLVKMAEDKEENEDQDEENSDKEINVDVEKNVEENIENDISIDRSENRKLSFEERYRNLMEDNKTYEEDLRTKSSKKGKHF